MSEASPESRGPTTLPTKQLAESQSCIRTPERVEVEESENPPRTPGSEDCQPFGKDRGKYKLFPNNGDWLQHDVDTVRSTFKATLPPIYDLEDGNSHQTLKDYEYYYGRLMSEAEQEEADRKLQENYRSLSAEPPNNDLLLAEPLVLPTTPSTVAVDETPSAEPPTLAQLTPTTVKPSASAESNPTSQAARPSSSRRAKGSKKLHNTSEHRTLAQIRAEQGHYKEGFSMAPKGKTPAKARENDNGEVVPQGSKGKEVVTVTSTEASQESDREMVGDQAGVTVEDEEGNTAGVAEQNIPKTSITETQRPSKSRRLKANYAEPGTDTEEEEEAQAPPAEAESVPKLKKRKLVSGRKLAKGKNIPSTTEPELRAPNIPRGKKAKRVILPSDPRRAPRSTASASTVAPATPREKRTGNQAVKSAVKPSAAPQAGASGSNNHDYPDSILDPNGTTLVNTGLKGTRGEPVYLPLNKKPSHTAVSRNSYYKKCMASISMKKRPTEEDIQGLYKEMGYFSATLDELLYTLGLETIEPWPRPYPVKNVPKTDPKVLEEYRAEHISDEPTPAPTPTDPRRTNLISGSPESLVAVSPGTTPARTTPAQLRRDELASQSTANLPQAVLRPVDGTIRAIGESTITIECTLKEASILNDLRSGSVDSALLYINEVRRKFNIRREDIMVRITDLETAVPAKRVLSPQPLLETPSKRTRIETPAVPPLSPAAPPPLSQNPATELSPTERVVESRERRAAQADPFRDTAPVVMDARNTTRGPLRRPISPRDQHAGVGDSSHRRTYDRHDDYPERRRDYSPSPSRRGRSSRYDYQRDWPRERSSSRSRNYRSDRRYR